jgi:hypothetical protein
VCVRERVVVGEHYSNHTLLLLLLLLLLHSAYVQ